MNKITIAKQILNIAKDISARHDNYPEDIRMYDSDPRSPFYDYRKHYPKLEFETDLEQAVIRVDSILKNDDIIIELNYKKYTFLVETDLVQQFEIDLGVLNNPSQIKKGELKIYAGQEEIDYLDLNQQQQKDLIKALKKYLEEDKDYTREYEWAKEKYEQERKYDFDQPDDYDFFNNRFF